MIERTGISFDIYMGGQYLYQKHLFFFSFWVFPPPSRGKGGTGVTSCTDRHTGKSNGDWVWEKTERQKLSLPQGINHLESEMIFLHFHTDTDVLFRLYFIVRVRRYEQRRTSKLRLKLPLLAFRDSRTTFGARISAARFPSGRAARNIGGRLRRRHGEVVHLQTPRVRLQPRNTLGILEHRETRVATALQSAIALHLHLEKNYQLTTPANSSPQHKSSE